MHICLVVSGRPIESPYGGEEKFVLQLRRFLARSGYKVTILGRKIFGVEIINSTCNNVVDISTAVRSRSMRVIRVRYLIFMFYMIAISLLFVLYSIAINKKERLSLIHAQDTGYAGLASIISARLLRIPVIVSSHGIRYQTLSKNLTGLLGRILLLFEHCIDVIVSKSADLLICVSNSTKEYFIKLGVPEAKIKVIPIGVEIQKFKIPSSTSSMIRKELSVQDYLVVGFIGRLSYEKNIFKLLEAFAQISKCYNYCRLMLVGGGPLEEKLRKIVVKKGLENKVIFTGMRSNVNELLSVIDIFVLPSYTEGCPTALLEAMASGRAIIASNIPAIREIVENEKEVLLFDPYNSRQLKDLILTLYNNPELRKKLGENARRKAEQYDVNIIFPKILQTYKIVLKSHTNISRLEF